MEYHYRTDPDTQSERALLVGVLLNHEPLIGDPLAELTELARSANCETVARVVQRRRSYDAATCVGKGKLEEIRQQADASDADVVIFDNDLSPSQIREIERATNRKVIDRSELILDIFASRARTAEARLQVELAQLEYTAPRLRGMWTHLERIAGAGGGTSAGAVGGVGTRGPGESQIEIDRRLVSKRVAFLKRQMQAIDRRRVREVRARSDFFTVSLVGYTNAGKSTLMNALTGAAALAEDKLFATLDTLTRKWSLGSGRAVLLSDTVGFIRKLPHHLVASFRATLEEAIHADLLLHVVDASSPEADEQVAAVEEVLRELGVTNCPTILVYNKADAIDDDAALALLRRDYRNRPTDAALGRVGSTSQFPGVAREGDSVLVSARTRVGLNELTELVAEYMRGYQDVLRLSVDAGDGKALNFIEQHGDVLSRAFDAGRATLLVRMSPGALGRLRGVASDLQCEQVREDDDSVAARVSAS